MDNPGWRARHRAELDNARASVPHRGADGRYIPTEQVVLPLPDNFIGGFSPSLNKTSVVPPQTQAKFGTMNTFPAEFHLDNESDLPTLSLVTRETTIESSKSLTNMSPVERSNALRRYTMDPPLQFMVGPLLRYDTIANGVWYGAVLIVTADSGSVYEPYPSLLYEWDPDQPPKPPRKGHAIKHSFDLGPHPADPHSLSPSYTEQHLHTSEAGPRYQERLAQGKEIYVYVGGAQSTFTFWRFMLEIPLAQNEMKIRYSINNGQILYFFVPGVNQNMRWAAHSCNGFSAGINPDHFRGPGFNTGYDPVWSDLLQKHEDNPFHMLMGGGDQLYCDAITREPELQDWINQAQALDRQNYTLTDEIASAIDRFYFNHYCSCFRSGAFARANSSIPMLNMCDDHDLIDGFGSYPDEFQKSPVFRTIGARAYFFYLLFQCFTNAEIDGLGDDSSRAHTFKSTIIGSRGPYVELQSHSILSTLGPKVWILLLDCRAERKKYQVCSEEEYKRVFNRLDTIPPGVEHLVVQLGIPIAYPRMVMLEKALGSKFNPLVALGKAGMLGLSGFVNKFNSEAELLDDLNDHWTADGHKRERNWFIQQMQNFALSRKIRITFVSGDVHCAAVGAFRTLKPKGKTAREIPPAQDHRYMLNVITSAIVNTPPPTGVIMMVSGLATKTHKTMHDVETDEIMIPLFATDPLRGEPRKQKYIMGHRNWCSVEWDGASGDLVFDIRVEQQQGHGVTTGYPIRAPLPAWNSSPTRFRHF